MPKINLRKGVYMKSLGRELFGFDPFAESLRSFDELIKAVYPKYNLVKHKDGSFSLEIAVAGFKKEDLSVEQRENTLVIEGKSCSEMRSYIHKGISSKPFKLLFPLGINWTLKRVSLWDGILTASFATKESEAQKIEIYEAPEPAQLTQEIKND
jgi:molecular chaperone IbpA